MPELERQTTNDASAASHERIPCSETTSRTERNQTNTFPRSNRSLFRLENLHCFSISICATKLRMNRELTHPTFCFVECVAGDCGSVRLLESIQWMRDAIVLQQSIESTMRHVSRSSVSPLCDALRACSCRMQRSDYDCECEARIDNKLRMEFSLPQPVYHARTVCSVVEIHCNFVLQEVDECVSIRPSVCFVRRALCAVSIKYKVFREELWNKFGEIGTVNQWKIAFAVDN